MIRKIVNQKFARIYYPVFLKKTHFIICVVCMTLTGCFSVNQVSRFPAQNIPLEDPQKARIYLGVRNCCYLWHRQKILVNGDYMGEMAAKQYICWETSPGDYTISTPLQHGESSYKFTAKAGEIYYLELYFRLLGWKQYYIRPLDEVKGKAFIEGLKPPSN